MREDSSAIYVARGTSYLTMLGALHTATKTDIQLIQQYIGKRLEPLTNPIGSFLLGREQQVS